MIINPNPDGPEPDEDPGPDWLADGTYSAPEPEPAPRDPRPDYQRNAPECEACQ